MGICASCGAEIDDSKGIKARKWCRRCLPSVYEIGQREYNRRWRLLNPGYQARVLAEWRALNPEYVESYKLSRRGPTERICRGCGEVFNREPGKREIGRFYCDDCRAAARIDSVGRLRTWDWERLRDEIIARDDGKCVRCGSTKDLQVHHKDWNHTNNDPSNLETICGECHRREHRVRWMPGEL